MKLGYVELAHDPRYANRGALSGIVFTDLGRPYQGSQVALEDAQAVGRVTGVEFSMEKSTATSDDELVQRISDWMTSDGIHFVLADLPAAALKDLARRLTDRPVMLINISAPDDSLRGADCANNVLHTYPSESMLSDALMQYLVAKGWIQILVLQGPAPEDAAMVTALQRSARKFRANVVETRQFLLTNDPRNREQSNIVLMTGGIRYDVVYVADSSGEFGRYVLELGQRRRGAAAASVREGLPTAPHERRRLGGLGSRQGGHASGDADALNRVRRGKGVPVERQADSGHGKGQSRFIPCMGSSAPRAGVTQHG